MPARFKQKWASLRDTTRRAALMIRPRLTRMPLPMQRFDDPFLPFGKAIISATHPLTSLYVFDFASYLSIGAAGIVALERTIAFANSAGEALTVLHVPIATGDYAVAISDLALNVDGLTVSDVSIAPAYAEMGFGVFLIDQEHEHVGTASLRHREMTFPPDMKLQLFGDEVIYASGGEDFAIAARLAMELPS